MFPYISGEQLEKEIKSLGWVSALQVKVPVSHIEMFGFYASDSSFPQIQFWEAEMMTQVTEFLPPT